MKFTEWVRIKVLGRITVLDILEYARDHKVVSLGLCATIDRACEHYNVKASTFYIYCEKFTRKEAFAFGADPEKDWWWPKGDWDGGRENFLLYLINYYQGIPRIYLP